MRIYKNIDERYGDDVEVTVETYIELCEMNDWEHGEFTANENGIFETTNDENILIAEVA